MEQRKIYRGPRLKGRDPGLKSMIWNKRKKHTSYWNRIKKQGKKKMRNLWDNFKCSNIQIIGVTKGEEKEQEIQNHLDK